MNKSYDKTLGSSLVSTWLDATRPTRTTNSITGMLGLAMANTLKPFNVATSIMDTMKATNRPLGLAMSNSFKPPNIAASIMNTMKTATVTAGLANTAAQMIGATGVATSIMGTMKAATTPVGLANTAAQMIGVTGVASAIKPPSIATSIMDTIKMAGVSAWSPRLRSGVSQSFLLSGLFANEVISALKSDIVLDEAPLLSKSQGEAQSSLEWFCSDPVLSSVYRGAVRWDEFKREELQVFLYNADRFVAKRLDIAIGWALSLCVPLNHFIQTGNSLGVILVLFAFMCLVEGIVKLRGYM